MIGILKRFFSLFEVDYRSSLRHGIEREAIITEKMFSGDAGFGDCPMFILYEFSTSDGRVIAGRFESMESSFHGLEIGDRIFIRYDKNDVKRNAPSDCLSIIQKITKR